MKLFKIVNNTNETGTLLKDFLDSEHNDQLQFFHQILFLSKVYDFVIDDRVVIVCDKEKIT